MDIRVDQNLPSECVDLLCEAGHNAKSVQDQDLVGATDSTLARICNREKRVLLTLDLDFADIRTYRPSEGSGIVVFRLRSQDRKTLQAVLRRMLTLLESESPRGKLWIVEAERVRIWE